MWGHRHIDDLERRLDAYLATHPYVIVQEPVPDGVLLRLQVRAHPPEELALLADDALHNLRSALDVRLVSLAEHLVGPLIDEQEKCLQLPDAATPDKLRKQQAQWGRQFATSVAEDLRRIVEPLLGHDTTEPTYWMRRHGNATAGEEADTHLALAARLRHLRRLSNVDKHRRQQFLCWAVDSFSASMTTPEQITWTIRPLTPMVGR